MDTDAVEHPITGVVLDLVRERASRVTGVWRRREHVNENHTLFTLAQVLRITEPDAILVLNDLFQGHEGRGPLLNRRVYLIEIEDRKGRRELTLQA